MAGDVDHKLNSTRRLYLDNAATSFPKPPCVTEAMVRYANQVGASAGRGAYAEAQESGRILAECRERINTLINGESPNHIIFTLNASDALNLAIHGLIACASREPNGHVVTTRMEHNSVLRPLNELVRLGEIEQSRIKCNPRTGLVDPDDIKDAIRPDTRLVAVIHGSNVTGTLQPITEIGAICRQRNIPFVVDAAQTVGHVPIDVKSMNIDLFAMPGHKGLLGPLGTGALYIRPGMEDRLATIREGGTGSVSELDTQPDFLPDRFEPGSHNAIGIAGLNESVKWILDRGIKSIRAHEEQLMRTMIDALENGAPNDQSWHYYGPKNMADRCGVFSVRLDGYTPTDLANTLENRFGLLTRAGIHCAPLAHKTIGTHHLGGTTRLSFGVFTTVENVKFAADALCKIAIEQARRPIAPLVPLVRTSILSRTR